MQGLACGANAEGVPFGRLALAPMPGSNSAATYASHITAFISGLKGKAQAFAQAYLRQSLNPPPRPTLPEPQMQPVPQPAPQPQQQLQPQQQYRSALQRQQQPAPAMQQQLQPQQMRAQPAAHAAGLPAVARSGGSQPQPAALTPPNVTAMAAAQGALPVALPPANSVRPAAGAATSVPPPAESMAG